MMELAIAFVAFIILGIPAMSICVVGYWDHKERMARIEAGKIDDRESK